MASRWNLVIASAFATLLVTSTGRSDPGAADRETARALMQDGRDLRDKGDLRSALDRFRAAHELMKVPTTGLEVARTQVALQLLVEARDTIAAIRKIPASRSDPAPFQDARAKAEDLDASLEGKVPSLTLVLEGASDEKVAVTIDDVLLPAAVVGLPRRLNPGHHAVVARSASFVANEDIELGEGQHKSLRLTLVRTAGALAEVDPPPADPQALSAIHHTPTVVTYVAAGVATAGLLVGVVAGASSLSRTGSLKDECPDRHCGPGEPANDLDGARAMATVANVGFVVTGVGAAAALATLLIGHRDEPFNSARGASAARVSPWIGLSSAGIRGAF